MNEIDEIIDFISKFMQDYLAFTQVKIGSFIYGAIFQFAGDEICRLNLEHYLAEEFDFAERDSASTQIDGVDLSYTCNQGEFTVLIGNHIIQITW